MSIRFALFVFIHIFVSHADRGQEDCQANEIYIECGSCEASCKVPIIKNCSKECRPPRCECRSQNGFVRAHDGACIHVNECQTYSVMTQIYPGHHSAFFDHKYNYAYLSTFPSREEEEEEKTTISQSTYVDEPNVETLSSDHEYGEELSEAPATSPISSSQQTPSSPKREDGPPSFGREEHSHNPQELHVIHSHNRTFNRGESRKLDQDEHLAELGKHYHVLDRDAALASSDDQPTPGPLFTDSGLAQVLPTNFPTFSDEEESESSRGLQPPQTYGARPVLKGEVADKYVPRMPSSGGGAPSYNPKPPGSSSHKHAHLAPTPALLHDDNARALYPPQRYRIYRRKRETMPIGPSVA